MKRLEKAAVLAAFLLLASAITSYAADTFSSVWYQNADGNWHVRQKDGTDLKNAWFCDDAVPENGKNVWYLLDHDGNMITSPFVQDGTGNYYSLEVNHNGYYGMLRYKNGTYDGIYLEFDQAHQGAFGAVKNESGRAALKAKYGVVSMAHINNSNVVYSSSIVGQAAKTAATGSSTLAGYEETEEMRSVAEEIMAVCANMDTDFKKEMYIIQWMVENLDYDVELMNSSVDPESYTIAGTLANRKGVCDGYAGTFDYLGKKCGLVTTCITGRANGVGGMNSHRWNQIRLDGEWYNVDVTWEDPVKKNSSGEYVPTNDYGFGNLKNEYINVTDEDLKLHYWNGGNTCTATKYGPYVVQAYLDTGEVKSYEEALKYDDEKEPEIIQKWRNTGYRVEEWTNEEEAFEIVKEEIASKIGEKKNRIVITFLYGGLPTASEREEFGRRAREYLVEEYGDVLDGYAVGALYEHELTNGKKYQTMTIQCSYK